MIKIKSFSINIPVSSIATIVLVAGIAKHIPKVLLIKLGLYIFAFIAASFGAAFVWYFIKVEHGEYDVSWTELLKVLLVTLAFLLGCSYIIDLTINNETIKEIAHVLVYGVTVFSPQYILAEYDGGFTSNTPVPSPSTAHCMDGQAGSFSNTGNLGNPGGGSSVAGSSSNSGNPGGGSNTASSSSGPGNNGSQTTVMTEEVGETLENKIRKSKTNLCRLAKDQKWLTTKMGWFTSIYEIDARKNPDGLIEFKGCKLDKKSILTHEEVKKRFNEMYDSFLDSQMAYTKECDVLLQYRRELGTKDGYIEAGIKRIKSGVEQRENDFLKECRANHSKYE